MKLKIVDEKKIILPCIPGDTYYTIERITKSIREIGSDEFGFLIISNTHKTIGKKIVEHKWKSYAQIVQALEIGRVDSDIFLTKEKAEKKFEKYWESWW